MKLFKKESEVYICDGRPEAEALARVTHLAIAAHQDDVEFMAYHGIVSCFGQKDKAFGAVVVTDGSGSPRAGAYAGYTDAEMMKVRRLEQKKAAFVGEYAALALLMYPSSEVKDKQNDRTVSDIYDILMASKPRVVYTHNPADKHDTHIAVLGRVLAAIRLMPKADRPERVYGCEIWRGLDWMDDQEKICLDCSPMPNLSESLMGVFDSQISGGKRYGLAITGRRVANATLMESHAVDTYDQIAYAIDLTPLIRDDNLDTAAFICESIDRFKQSVVDKVKKFI